MTDIDTNEPSIIEIFAAFDRNIAKINDVVENDRDVAVILTVSTFDVLLADLFKKCKDKWFISENGYTLNSQDEKTVEYRKKIRKYFKSIREFNAFLESCYVHKDCLYPDIESAYETLFPKNGRSKLNFQNLKDEGGSRETYKLFFNIDLMKMLASTENESCNKWEKLNRLFEDRHKIIHKGANTSFSKDEIKDTLEALKYMKSELDNKMKSLSR